MSKSFENIKPFRILNQIRQYAIGNTILNMVAWLEGGTMRLEFNYLTMSAWNTGGVYILPAGRIRLW